MPLSEDLRNELAAIAPASDCDRLAELSGLAHSAGSVHLLGRGEISVHLDLASNAVARRAFGILRAFGVEAEIRTYKRRAFDRATRYQVHVPGTQRAQEVLTEAGHPRAGAPSGRETAASSRRTRVLPRRVPARCACSAAGRSADRARRIWRSAPPRSKAPSSSPRSHRSRCWTAAATRSRTRRAARRSRTCSPRRGRATSCWRSTSTRSSLRPRSRANRQANADHANLVRSSRAAHEQVVAVRALVAAGRLDQLRPELQEIAALRLDHPSLSLRELALKCQPPTTKAAAHRRLRTLQRLAETVF